MESKFKTIEEFKIACKKILKSEKLSNEKANLRQIQEKVAEENGFKSYHELKSSFAPSEAKTVERGRNLKGPVFSKGQTPSRYYGYFLASPFKDERKNPKAFSGYEVPDAPLRKLLRYLSETSILTQGQKPDEGSARGIFVNYSDILVVEDTCDGDSVVAHIDAKKLSYLKRKNVLHENSYGGYKDRAIYDANQAAAKTLLASMEDDDSYDKEIEAPSNIKPSKLRSEAEARRQKTTKEVAEEFKSGRAQQKMKDNLMELVAREGLRKASFKGIARLEREGWTYDSLFGDLVYERFGKKYKLPLEKAIALEKMKDSEIYIGTPRKDGRMPITFNHIAQREAKKEKPQSFGDMMMGFGGAPSLSDFIPDNLYTLYYLEAEAAFE